MSPSYPTPDPTEEAPHHLSSLSALQQVAFALGVGVALLMLYALLRAALLTYNSHQIAGSPLGEIIEAFRNGLRFDLRVVVVAIVPLVLVLPFQRALDARRAQIYWLTVVASVTSFIGLIELDFYREFNQRLNSLAIQYMKEDPATVSSMIWYGFPVVRYLLAWATLTLAMYATFSWLDRRCRPNGNLTGTNSPSPWWLRIGLLAIALPLLLIAGRGTLRQGSPLRWGDAYTTNSPFLNKLGLNGTVTFIEAARGQVSEQRANLWKSGLPQDEATKIVRAMLLQPSDRPYEPDMASVRRVMHSPEKTVLPIRNVVVILMESFAGRYVGALGANENVTPYFDALAKEGLLFTRFFSAGTHTHQGMFATMGCFPNLPGFEYLMKTPESAQQFSGLPQLLKARNYDNLYVYNGDFMWDNQQGFFGNQGMTRFIGRTDYLNPVFSDPTWGVSDQDMFDRAAEELAKQPRDKPFYALLQTLSNHVPYALPASLPVERVTNNPLFNDHLTAMRYADWALGQFFDKARKQPYYKDTLFVLLGDHGFANDINLTDINLLRFHVPLLMIAPGVQQRFGTTRDTVATQTDVAPTIMGRLGGTTAHQCWGRDVLALPAADKGLAVFKPSGGENIAALLRDDQLLVKASNRPAQLYRYTVGKERTATELTDEARTDELKRELDAYLLSATRSLLERTAGVGTPP